MANEFARDMLRVFNIMHIDKSEPRVVAIVTAAYIENYLTGLLKEKMPGLTSALATRLFRPGEGAIGSLARKIDMARALSVLTPREADEAVRIARIRNRFAHNLDVDNFDHEEVAPLIDALTSSRGVSILHEDGTETPVDKNWDRARRFTNAALGLCVIIMGRHITEHPFSYEIKVPKAAKPDASPSKSE